jgi:hypothetical protein
MDFLKPATEGKEEILYQNQYNFMNIIDTVSQTQTMAKRSLIKRSLKIRWNEV